MFKVYFFDDYSGKCHMVITKIDGLKTYVAKRVDLVFEEVPEGSFFKEPTIEISWFYAEDFKNALKQALERQKLPVSAVEGELKATKFHLEDMRKLVFGEEDYADKKADDKNSRRS